MKTIYWILICVSITVIFLGVVTFLLNNYTKKVEGARTVSEQSTPIESTIPITTPTPVTPIISPVTYHAPVEEKKNYNWLWWLGGLGGLWVWLVTRK